MTKDRVDGGECVKIMSLNPKEEEILNMWSCQYFSGSFVSHEWIFSVFISSEEKFCTRKSTADQKSWKKQWKCFLGLKLDCNCKLIILTMILWKVQFETAVQSKKKRANVFFLFMPPALLESRKDVCFFGFQATVMQNEENKFLFVSFSTNLSTSLIFSFSWLYMSCWICLFDSLNNLCFITIVGFVCT